MYELYHMITYDPGTTDNKHQNIHFPSTGMILKVITLNR